MVLLQGLGQSAATWSGVIGALPDDVRAIALPVPLSVDFTLPHAAREVVRELDRLELDHVNLCGLSLGAMVALQISLDAPDRVARLILSGGQVRPNPAMMTVQTAVMRILPSRAVAPPGVSKSTVLATLRAVGQADFRPRLSGVAAPTLVMCGSRDRANLAPARQLASGIPRATLDVIPGVGHEWNRTHPDQFAARVASFVAPRL